jgi:PAS domain S-box-containing protein
MAHAKLIQGTSIMRDENARPPTTPPPSGRRREWLLFPRPIAWLVLVISLIASVGGWFIVSKHAELQASKRFEQEARRIAGSLAERMQIYEDVLHGAVGLFAASYSVERGEWRNYLNSVSIERRFPGIDGVGFIAYVPRSRLDEFVRTTRADKTPDFQVSEPGKAKDLLIVKYIEPEGIHRAMLGTDVGVEAERRKVAERACATGRAALSSAMMLAEDRRGPRAGFMMLVPVYHHEAPVENEAERWAALEGWVFARFITEELMRAVLGPNPPPLHLRIIDVDTPGPDNVVFDQDPEFTKRGEDRRALFHTATHVRFGGRSWVLQFASEPVFEVANRRNAGLWAGGIGGLFTLLLFGIAWSLSHTKERALAMAADMTSTLRETNDRLQSEIKERLRTEAGLEHERFLLRTLMDNVPERIYFKDDHSRFLRNSRAHLRAFGLDEPEQAIGKSDFDFFSQEHARQAYEDEQRLMATGQAVTKEERETWPDGSTTWVLSTKMPLRDEDGKIVGTFGISRDITDQKRAEEAMRLAKEAAEDASQTKSRFLANMSHELRTPLNSVIGFANIMLKNKAGTLGPSELNFLDRILANGKHLLTLINEILDLSKIEARKTEVQLGPVAIDQLIRETVSQQESLVRDRSVRLVADLPPRVEPILSDADKLRQVIINLLGNALKFTEQGTVTVRLVTDPEQHRPIRIDVADTGIGIPREKLGVIFEAFQQAEAGTARKYGGTGLGLTISQALCRLMGYRIEVQSEPGRGSTFSVHLATPAGPIPAPSAPPAPAVQDKVRRPPSRELGGKLVLVIDDELDSRTLLTHAIEEFGCQAIAANSGEQGLRMAREFRPQLITVDLMMPQLNGWQVIQALKSDPDLCDIPVVVVSIVASENRSRLLGVVELLQKPVTRPDLLTVLRRCLATPHPRILIVDDDKDSRELLANYLDGEACESRMAMNGKEALEMLEKFPADLILLDLLMPVMDGMTFLNHIRSTPRFSFLPVVIVTAKELSAAESQQLRHMAQDIVKKGDSLEPDLERVLHRFLGSERLSERGVAS